MKPLLPDGIPADESPWFTVAMHGLRSHRDTPIYDQLRLERAQAQVSRNMTQVSAAFFGLSTAIQSAMKPFGELKLDVPRLPPIQRGGIHYPKVNP